MSLKMEFCAEFSRKFEHAKLKECSNFMQKKLCFDGIFYFTS